MKVLPVIARELRAQSRQVFTFWLRGLGVLALLIGGIWLVDERAFEPNVGGHLYSRLHLLTYFALWLLVPVGAADCISRERREGTLGLLFLTPLRPPHIVIAKGFAHGWRAVTLILAVVPVLMVPLLIGGVVWLQVALSAVVCFDAICWCLAAALAASSLAKHNNRAMAFTMLFACIGFVGFPWIVGVLTGLNSPATWNNGYRQSTYDFFVGFWLVAMPAGDLGYVLRMVKPPQIVTAISIASAFSVSVLVFAVMFAAHRIRRSWREEPPSARVEKLEQVLLQPVVGKGFLHRWMRRKLERNPIGWLEQRQWSGRMVAWVWFAIIVTIYSMAVTRDNFFYNFESIQAAVIWLFVLSMAVTAVGSFRREREAGVLELLLVSPLGVRQIINGRLLGLWGQFLPAMATLLAIWVYLGMPFASQGGYAPVSIDIRTVGAFLVSAAVIPVAGLYFSLQCRSIIVALIMTVVTIYVVPFFVAVCCEFLAWAYGTGMVRWRSWRPSVGSLAVVQILIATMLYLRLRQKLERRQFPLTRA